jgi:poly-gamma-glutamate synthesis protein (capsule biosynthesis protein)
VLHLGARLAVPGPCLPLPRSTPAADALAALGVDCVTLANNHALAFGLEALEDTFEHLQRVGIRWVAREPVTLESGNFRLAVVGLTDHPSDSQRYVAYADLHHEDVPEWAVPDLPVDAVFVTLHWGPNLAPQPVPYARRAARRLVELGATLVAGHSAHVFHGVEGRVLYDPGDFVDDYRVDPVLRNDLGPLWLVDLDAAGPRRVEAVPLKLDYCYTRLACGEDRPGSDAASEPRARPSATRSARRTAGSSSASTLRHRYRQLGPGSTAPGRRS